MSNSYAPAPAPAQRLHRNGDRNGDQQHKSQAQSYADAVEHWWNGDGDGSVMHNGDGKEEQGGHDNGTRDDKEMENTRMAPILRITDTGAGVGALSASSERKYGDGNGNGDGGGAGEEGRTSATNGVNGVNSNPRRRPNLGDRQESKREFEAEGIDDTPKSPARYRSRKTAATTTTKSKHAPPPPPPPPKLERSISDLTSIAPSLAYTRALSTDASQLREDTIDLVSGHPAGQAWHASGMRFAPWNVPLQRRLQTATMLLHTLSIGLLVSSFFFLCAIPLLWPILVPYMIYCMTSKAATSGELSHRLEWMRRSSFWSLFASYFPARLHRSAELPPTRKYIFGYHPHGIISLGAWTAFATEALGFAQLFPGITNTLLTLDSLSFPCCRRGVCALFLYESTESNGFESSLTVRRDA